MPYQSINPATGKVLKTFKELTEPQLEKALKTAAACFEGWRQTSFTRRAAVASKAAAILRKRVDEFARPMTIEMRKRIEEARGEVSVSADIIDYYAKNAERFLAPHKYAATTATSLLAPFQLQRRAPGPHDVEIEILFCGVCHSGNTGAGRALPFVPNGMRFATVANEVVHSARRRCQQPHLWPPQL